MMDPPLESVDASLMEDSTQNPFPWLKPKIHGLVREAFEIFVQSGPESVAAFLKEGSTQNTSTTWLDSNIRTLVREAFEIFVQSGPESVAAFLKEGSTQNTSTKWLDSKIHTLVHEEFERCLKFGPACSVNRREQIQERDRSNLRLRFQRSMPRHFFVGKKIEGRAICVKLIDATTTTATDDIVASGAVSSMTLDVVVLDSDFGKEDHHDWTWEHFDSKLEPSREGKGPLLEGDLQVPLKGGVGSMGEFKFTDISTPRRSGKFRLGVKVASGFYMGIRVREAITAPFKVIHFKKESQEKRVPRALDDDVCKLMGIAEDGAFHKNLKDARIFKVNDFLWKLGLDPEGLKKIIGKTVTDKSWKILGDHAKESVPGGKYHVYYANDTENYGVVFKNMSELCGLIEDGKYYSAETLSENKKVSVDTLKREAYDNWKHIVEFDVRMLDMNQSAAPSEQVFKIPVPAAGDVNQTVAGACHGFLGSKDVRMECGSSSSVLSENYVSGSRTSFSPIGDMDSVLRGKSHVYYADNTQNSGVVFKNMPESCGLIEGGKHHSAETLSDSKKLFWQEPALNKVAGDKGKGICVDLLQLEMQPSKKACSSQTDVVTGAPESCPSGVDLASLSYLGPPVNSVLDAGDPPVSFDQQAPVPCQPPSVPSVEANENSMPDSEDNDSIDLTSLLQEADGNTTGYGDSFEQRNQLGGSNSPRNEERMIYGGGNVCIPSWLRWDVNMEVGKAYGWGGRRRPRGLDFLPFAFGGLFKR